MIMKWILLLFGASVLTVHADKNLNKGGPLIIPTKEEIILQKGQNATIQCKGDYPLQFKQEELSEDSSFSQFSFTTAYLPSMNSSYKYNIALELKNVDEFAVGYYACFDNTIDSNDVLIDVQQEPVNSPHISYIYIYVNGTDKVIVPMSAILKVDDDSNEIVIKCRPTLPDVNITLLLENMEFPETVINPIHFSKVGYVVSSEDIQSSLNIITCSPNGYSGRYYEKVTIYKQKKPERLRVTLGIQNDIFVIGETFTISCKTIPKTNTSFDISWRWPNHNRPTVTFTHNLNDTNVKTYWKNLTIINATSEDKGNYSCKAGGGFERSKEMKLREPGFLQWKNEDTEKKDKKIAEISSDFYFHRTLLYANPPPKIHYYFNGKKITKDDKKYSIDQINGLCIHNITIYDSGTYQCVASNPYQTISTSVEYNFLDGPYINFNTSDEELVQGQKLSLWCTVESNPKKYATWTIDGKEVKESQYDSIYNKYTYVSILEQPFYKNTNITCGSDDEIKVKKVFVYELNSDGFGIPEKRTSNTMWIPENENLIVTCLASNNKYLNSTWLDSAGYQLDDSMVTYSREVLSFKAKLRLRNIQLSQTGNYKCVGFGKNGTNLTDELYITVAETQPLVITFPEKDSNIFIPSGSSSYNKIEIKCEGKGTPPPKVHWEKDGKELLHTNVNNITNIIMEHNKVMSTIVIQQVNNSTAGIYQCIFQNNNQNISKTYTLAFVKDKLHGPTLSNEALGVVAGVLLALVLLVIYLIWRVWKDKKQLRKMGMGDFHHGRKLNPNLGLDEQADMLPYDESFEFPRKKLILGELLGAGAFGAVYKAEARGIINAERTDIVAVKMVKKDADLSHIVALASELKIMIHLGKHVNIVNLLGACTKNLVKSELLVIVEYCEFGNLHNYLRRHREVFIDQLTDNNSRYGKTNRAYSCSNNSTGTQGDYCSDANVTQNTDNTFLNTGNSNRSTRLASERSNRSEKRSESNEYSDGRQLRPLCSRDLLAWSFQIARGMEYLASRKVFHGDLATRNILLAHDNIVKICDFGLARSMYKNEEYLKQENSLLPVKWLAIECMTERAFSTQSDIWAFGIVLWELFSLAMSPYPNVSHADLLLYLQQGNRLEKPAHADDRLYEVMLQCWQSKPQARPSFSVLEEKIGAFLDDNERNHYVDLNAEYINYNLNRGQDYLAMIAAPDYNIATPSPNKYVNVDNERRFFPNTPVPEDEHGYLQVTPKCGVTPRDHNKFEFKPRNSETESHELTPMLSSNNLPSRSISESDQEGNLPSYSKMFARIEEEDNDIEDVFENNVNNIKNTVTNPTYITIPTELEKKYDYGKKEFPNNYVNVPNGLVK